jgi:thiamine pyrophosphate-dependent acetolactate synthase large subunit-like protein
VWNVATIGALAPQRFRHVVLDNGVYASTGNQPTISSRVKLEEIAGVAGYRAVARVRDVAGIAPALRRQLAQPGPTLLLIETRPEVGPPAPRIPYTPPEMTARVATAIARLAGAATAGAR